MKITLRALVQKVTLVSAAFVLAVSTLTASMPFILSDNASAAPYDCTVSYEAVSTANKCVKTLSELKSALQNPAISQIILDATIETTETIVIARSGVTLNGHDEKIKFIGDTPDWNAGDNYVLQVYNATNVSLNSLQLEGADAGLLVNGSEVKLTGNARFIGHEFGNIELSKGVGITRAPKLTTSAASLTGNGNETTQKPYVWVDTDSVADAVIAGTGLYKGLNRSTNPANAGQEWYYANVNNTGVVAEVVETGAVYETIQLAVDAAAPGQTVRLQKNVTLDTYSVRILKAITIDGNGKTVQTSFVRGAGGVSNAAFVVLQNNVAIKNLAVKGIGGASAAHGVVIDTGKAGIQLEDITLENGAAGVIINGSSATIKNITTKGNNWYGINVDAKGLTASLNILGANAHNEAVAIHTETPTAVSINTNGLYHVGTVTVDGYHNYILGPVEAPVITNSPVYVNIGQANNQATWSHSGNGVAQFEYREYRNMTEADADTDGNTASYWHPDSPATKRSQTVGQSWTSNKTLYYRVVAIDAAGNRSVPSALGTVVIDKTAPAAPVMRALSNGTPLNSGDVINQSDIRAEWGAVADATLYQYRYWNTISGDDYEGELKAWSKPASSALFHAGTFTQGEGTHFLQVRAGDAAGNWSGWSNAFEVTFDNTAPVVTIDPTTATTSSPTLTGTVDDDTATVTVTVDGVDYIATVTGTAWSVTLPARADGDYTVEVVALDAAGNVSVPATATLSIVTTANPDDTTTEDEDDTTTTATIVLPPATNPAGQPAVQGDSTQNTGTPGVEGTATENVAQAVDSEANQGTLWGLAWYWWLLILAGVATVFWWVIAALRRRQGEA